MSINEKAFNRIEGQYRLLRKPSKANNWSKAFYTKTVYTAIIGWGYKNDSYDFKDNPYRAYWLWCVYWWLFKISLPFRRWIKKDENLKWAIGLLVVSAINIAGWVLKKC